ncbi:GAF and ANTAR domain-containing protein [Amycolatopsis regifaucium]|uniref:Transcriptional regulator n=1 Tax=Amycolatopsis regifaucium TaxID=546365 RepID=A0A154MG69_9PSEU|nr:GAF and ANTAR domain-containing protein [Amycolatopsis regifaucium]KZB83416.1 transcriptional regulator [Amycolatopsis regifaucium]OKA08881.1 transcriptional regulator [Amycolatopsis regifaucium]SFI90459.1 GAF domain-containing protein [Amycolatopsis regifaucium]
MSHIDTGDSWPGMLDEVTGALETLTSILDDEDDFRVMLQQVCRQVTKAVPGVDEATVTLLRGDEPHTAAATSDLVAELDRDQYRNGGPCLEAARHGTLQRVTVSEALERWPKFAGDARDAGFDSFLSAPLVADSEHAGGINCYGTQARGFSDLDQALLELYTTATEAILRLYRRYLTATELAGQLRAALTHRAVIDQAKGILMALRQISADDAFTLLVEQSQRENVKVRDIAERFVAHAVGNPQAS